MSSHGAPTIAKPPPSYKPIISPWLSLSFLIVFITFQAALPFYLRQQHILGVTTTVIPAEIIALTNLERQQAGLKPVKPHAALDQAAQAKVADMLAKEYWDHISPTDTPPWTFILDAGYDYRFAGENLAKDFYTSQSLVKAWMDSPGHRANILNANYQEIGIAIAEGKLNGQQTVLVVQMFGTQYTAQDYAQVTEPAEVFTGADLLEPSVWQLVLTSNFWAAKMISLAVIVVLLGKLISSIIRFFTSPQKQPLSKHHWGHFIFLLTIGALIVMTHDGDVLGLF